MSIPEPADDVVVHLHPGGRWARVPVAAAGATKLGAQALRVYIAIASFANDQGKCWPGQRLIATMTGIKERRGLHREIAALVAAGLLKAEQRRRPDGGKTSNLYTIVGVAPGVPDSCGSGAAYPCGSGAAYPCGSGAASKGTKTDRTYQGEQKGATSGAPDLGRCAPSLHSEEDIREVDRLVAETTALLTGRRPSIADPVAYAAGTKEWKRQNRLATLNTWVGQRFNGNERMQAWEALAEAASASSRAATPRETNRTVDRLDKLHRLEQQDKGGR